MAEGPAGSPPAGEAPAARLLPDEPSLLPIYSSERPFFGARVPRRVGGRMLDEWVAGLPGVRSLAFRHLFVCRKP